MSKNSFLDKIEVKSPCSQNWEEMLGSETTRFCSHCDSSVNNLSAMTRKQALKIVRGSGGAICVRYVKNPETNAPVFRDKLYQISRRTGIAAGVLGASLSLSAASYAQGGIDFTNLLKTETEVLQSKKTDKEKTESKTASVSGTVTDPNGAVIPNVTINLINSATNETRSTSSNDEGFYEFTSVAAGNYSIKAEGSGGFRTITLENVAVAESKEIKRDVQLEVGEQYVTVGFMAAVEFTKPLFQAVSGDELEEAKNLIVKGESVNTKDKNYGSITPLFLAVENGNLEIAEMLLDFGAKINAKDENKQTPLMRLDSDASPELVRLLIKHGAKVNLTDDEGNTALILAANYAKAEVLRELVTNGANVNARNKDGRTALMNAAEEGNLENIRALILAGADVNTKNKEGETARDLADDEEIEKLLESYGAKIN
ncbi:MAG: ankyrin repeat domain-containing protein [Acidobacteriota bacterium]|nr:ankyrin repeat domain-containing protein [Acidobacteriota bacterium]